MSLAAKSLSAVKSNYVGTIVRVGAQFFAQVLIMRELGPELVGTFGYVLLLYGVLALIIDQGFGWSLIQGDFQDSDEVAVVLSRIALASAIGAIFVFSISYPIAEILNNELLGTVFRYSAPSCLLIGLFIVPQAKLRAELRFKEIQIATSGAYVIAYPVVGVAMAWSGFGVWSLLAAWYVQGLIQAVIAYRYSPHSYQLTNPFRNTTSGSLGWHVASINILNWAVDGVAGVYAARLGAVVLGNFNAAMMLARTPAQQLVQTLQTILFSTASVIGDDQSKLKKLYLTALATISFVVIPAYCYASTHAEIIISILFGDKWQSASGIFSTLAIGMVALSITTLSGSILTAVGGQKIVLHSQIICLVMMVVGVAFVADFDFKYVGFVITISYWSRLVVQIIAISNLARIAAIDFFSVLKGPLVLGFVMVIPSSVIHSLSFSQAWIEGGFLAVKMVVILAISVTYPRMIFCGEFVGVMRKFDFINRLINGGENK